MNMAYIQILLITAIIICPTHQVNIAYRKPANQTGAWNGQTADRAVDGDRQVCAQSDTGDYNVSAELWVYLQATARVTSITVWNTNNAGYGRMRYFTVGVQAPGQTEVICGRHESSVPVPAGGSVTYQCPGTTSGSVVHLKKLTGYPGQHNFMICEVEVEGEYMHSTSLNIAFNKPTNQTGTHQKNQNWTSDKAVDGLIESPTEVKTHCARPDNSETGQPAEWWVDLLQLYTVRTITVYNSKDYYVHVRMVHFRLEVINSGLPVTQCGDDNPVVVPRGGSRTLTCPAGTVGRYVRFVRTAVGGHTDDDISRVILCEVVVTGALYTVNEPVTLTPATPEPVTPTPVSPAPVTSTPVTSPPLTRLPRIQPDGLQMTTTASTPLPVTISKIRSITGSSVDVRTEYPVDVVAWSVAGVFMVVSVTSVIIITVLGLKYRDLKADRSEEMNHVYVNNDISKTDFIATEHQRKTIATDKNTSPIPVSDQVVLYESVIDGEYSNRHDANQGPTATSCNRAKPDSSNEGGYEEMLHHNRQKNSSTYEHI